MGSPGCGKTTVGQLLGKRLGLPVIDVDNDHLEKCWGSPVSEKVDFRECSPLL
jgi:shikimate kinase